MSLQIAHQDMSCFVPAISVIQQDFKETKMVTFLDICQRYELKPGRVFIMCRGVTLMPTEKFDVTEHNWLILSLTAGG